jgi:hypothetical protein
MGQLGIDGKSGQAVRQRDFAENAVNETSYVEVMPE